MRKQATALVGLIVLILAVTGTAWGSSLQVKHKPFNQMTRQDKVHFLHKQIRHDHSIIRFWRHHWYLVTSSPDIRALSDSQVHWAHSSLRIATKNLHKLIVPRYATLGFPPHHRLWMCEHSHEATDWHNEDTGNNEHYGGLQMTYSWGWNQYAHYGLKGDPAHYTQAQQEWAAERGLVANGYSHSWVIGQWAHYDCLVYV